MDSPSYDLGSLCSSPLLYEEGEDFLGHPVNIFEDEDISFDLLDTFAADFSIAGNITNEDSKTAARAEDPILTSECLTLKRNKNETKYKEYNSDEKTLNGESNTNKQDIASNNEHSDSIHDLVSASECFEGPVNEVTNTSTEHLQSNVLCKNADYKAQYIRHDATENHALSQSDRAINRVTTDGRVDNSSAATGLLDLRKHSSENTYSNNNSNEKTISANDVKLSSHGAPQKTFNKGFDSVDTRKLSKTTGFKGIDDSVFSVKTSPFRRCVPQKTFYSPFWTPEKSTTKHEKSPEDGLSNTQRNVDILYCCNYTCGSQKRYAKKTRFAVKNETSFRDGNKYTDILKRKSVSFRQQGKPQKPYNKAINGELSFHLDDIGANNDKWISLPAIFTSSKLPKTASRNKAIGDSSVSSTLSMTSVEGLINKYKGHRFDLAEQEKRYKLKPFK